MAYFTILAFLAICLVISLGAIALTISEMRRDGSADLGGMALMSVFGLMAGMCLTLAILVVTGDISA